MALWADSIVYRRESQGRHQFLGPVTQMIHTGQILPVKEQHKQQDTAPRICQCGGLQGVPTIMLTFSLSSTMELEYRTQKGRSG